MLDIRIVKEIIRAMLEKADELEIKKGAIVVCDNQIDRRYYERILTECYAFPNKALGIQIGRNYLATAFGKIFQSIRTLQPSWEGETLAGECDSPGALFSEDYHIIVSFDGNVSKHNLSVAQAGIDRYDELAEE